MDLKINWYRSILKRLTIISNPSSANTLFNILQKSMWQASFFYHQLANSLCGKAASCLESLLCGLLVWESHKTHEYMNWPPWYDWTILKKGVKPKSIKCTSCRCIVIPWADPEQPKHLFIEEIVITFNMCQLLGLYIAYTFIYKRTFSVTILLHIYQSLFLSYFIMAWKMYLKTSKCQFGQKEQLQESCTQH